MLAVVAGAEQERFGSKIMATTLRQKRVDVQGMLDNDVARCRKETMGQAVRSTSECSSQAFRLRTLQSKIMRLHP